MSPNECKGKQNQAIYCLCSHMLVQYLNFITGEWPMKVFYHEVVIKITKALLFSPEVYPEIMASLCLVTQLHCEFVWITWKVYTSIPPPALALLPLILSPTCSLLLFTPGFSSSCSFCDTPHTSDSLLLLPLFFSSCQIKLVFSPNHTIKQVLM